MVEELFNPLVVIEDAEAGRYAVYAGVFDIDADLVSSLLVATTYPFDPQNFIVTITAPDVPVTTTVTGTTEMSVSLGTAVQTSTLQLSAESLPHTATVDAGGEVNVFEADLGNSLCTGWTSDEPALAFNLSADDENDETLVIFFEGTLDTTLIVRDPNGDYLCADDSAADTNWNPWMDIDFVPGEYAVWVGTYNQGDASTGTLTVTNDTSAVPAMLEKR